MTCALRTAAVLVLSITAYAPWAHAQSNVLQALATQRHWIGYTPRNYNPLVGQQPSQAQIRADLEQLYDDGWRKIYNETLDGNLQHFPRLAKEVGFDTVLAGISMGNPAQLAREQTNAQAQNAFIDGYLVGNGGLASARYTGSQLTEAVNFFSQFDKPVTTSEASSLYRTQPVLPDIGDFTFVNIQPWLNGALNPLDPAAMAQAVREEYVAIKAQRPDRLVVIREAWWPTAGHPGATEANQIAFYQSLANKTDADGNLLLFAWGESYDQPWRLDLSPFGVVGDDWGLYEADGSPKAIIDELQNTYTRKVPILFPFGDYNRDGFVNARDDNVWRASYGATVGVPGSGADGNFDTVIDAVDYAIWRENVFGLAAATPEPTTALLAASVAICAACGARRRRP